MKARSIRSGQSKPYGLGHYPTTHAYIAPIMWTVLISALIFRRVPINSKLRLPCTYRP